MEPNDAWAHAELGYAYFMLDRYAEALASLKEAMRLDLVRIRQRDLRKAV